MATAYVERIKKYITKDKDQLVDNTKRKRLITEEDTPPQENVKKGRKITIKIERGDKIVVGNQKSQKVIDFVLLSKEEIKQKGEEEEEKQMISETTKRKVRENKKKPKVVKAKIPTSKNKPKVITVVDDENEDEDVSDIIDIEDEENDDDEDDEVLLVNGHIEQEDEDEILKQNKKITQKVSPFLCQELGNAAKDPRQNKLVQEIQSILQQHPEYKLNLILDLDETLVNTVWVSSENQSKLEETYRYKMPSNKNILTIYYQNNEGVQKEFVSIMRPHLKEFMTEAKKYFNIYVYSHGRKEYVLKLLDKIDPRRDLFNRNHIFKNDGQVNLKTQKDIRNIIDCNTPTQLEQVLKSSIIIDDIYEVWLEETLKNVVPIKRFQPLNEFLQKNNYCTIFMNHNKQYVRFPKSHQEYFEDQNIQDSQNQFLKGLQRYLCSTALQFYNKKLIKKDQNADIREYLTYQNLVVLNQLDINISLLEQDEIFDVYKYIALSLGANVSHKNYRYALVHKESIELNQRKIVQMKQQNPALQFIHVQWLIDSYFLHYQLDTTNYIVQ